MTQPHLGQADVTTAGNTDYDRGIQYRYDAFISYRHTHPDSMIAEKLSAALETYRVPDPLVKRGFPARLAKVFRDRDELPTSSNLGRDIEQALIASRYLIVVCSPRTVQSVWIDKEIAMFMSLGRKDRILTLLIEGEPVDSFPKLLTAACDHDVHNKSMPALTSLGEEPLAADIRSGSIQKTLRLLDAEKLRLVAPIIGCSFDDLKQREHERRVRKRITALSSILTLAAVLVIYSSLMWKNAEDHRALAEAARYAAEEARIEADDARFEAEDLRFDAEDARRVALEERDKALISQSLSLSQQSEMLVEKGDRMLAMIAALHALPGDMSDPDRPYVPYAELALYKSIYYDHFQGRAVFHHESLACSAYFSPDGTLAATSSADNTACIWETATGKLVYALAGHTDAVYMAAFSPDGKWIATTSDDTTAIIWDAETGKAVHVLTGHFASVQFASFSPDSELLATASNDGSVIIWDVQTGVELQFFGGSDYIVTYCCFSPDGGLLAAGGSIGVWDVETGSKLYSLDDALSVSFSPDGSLLAVGYPDGRAEALDAGSGSVAYTLPQHAGAVNRIVFSPDGLLLLTASEDYTACVWDSWNGELVSELSHDDAVNYASFWMESSLVVTCSLDDLVTLWDSYSGEKLHVFDKHTYYVNTAEFDLTGGYLITASNDFSACIWDLFSCEMVEILYDHTDSVNGIRYGPYGDVFLTFSDDGTAIIRDAATRTCLAALNGWAGAVTDAVFSPDGSMVAVSFEEETANIYDAYSGELRYSLNGHTDRVNSVAFSPDMKRIATCSADQTVMVWDMDTGKELITLSGYDADVTRVFFGAQNQIIAVTDWYEIMANDAEDYRPMYTLDQHTSEIMMASLSLDGTKLLSCSKDGTARVFDTATGEQLGMVEKVGRTIMSARFSPDGKYILTTCGRMLDVWETETCTHVKELVYRVEDELLINAVMSSDNRRIITISQNNEAAVWDFSSGEQVMGLDLHYGQVYDAVFSPLNDEIVTASADNSVMVWSVFADTQSLIDYAKSLVGDRELTEQEMEKLLIK